MESDDIILISESERRELKKAYNLIKKVESQITIDYEEFFAIKTALEYLNNAINYKKKYFS